MSGDTNKLKLLQATIELTQRKLDEVNELLFEYAMNLQKEQEKDKKDAEMV